MASTLTVKDMNQEIVRDCMKGLGPVSKSVLSRKTGLSFPTVSKTVDLLCETGEVEEAGTEKSGGGRCAALYRLNPVFSLYLLLTVENDTIHWSLKDLEGNSLKEETSEENFPILTAMEAKVESIRTQFPCLKGIVIGAAGMVSGGKIVLTAGGSELTGVNLQEHFSRKFGIPVRAVNDMNAVAAGRWSLAGRSDGCCVCIYLGKNGMGAGIVINGKVWQGASDFAGELGFLPDMPGKLRPADKNFAPSRMLEIYCKIIQIYASVLNPERVVLYRNPFLDGALEELYRECEKVIPEHSMPLLEISDSYETDYEQGLLVIANMLKERDI